jgi:hypothetical protein
MWPAYPHSIFVDGARASCRWMDGCLGHATLISIVDNAQYFDTGEVPPSEFCSRSMPPQSQSRPHEFAARLW